MYLASFESHYYQSISLQVYTMLEICHCNNIELMFDLIKTFSSSFSVTGQVQAHGSDAMVDEDNCVFFLPHRPRSEICEPPFFLFMKGTGNLSFL